MHNQRFEEKGDHAMFGFLKSIFKSTGEVPESAPSAEELRLYSRYNIPTCCPATFKIKKTEVSGVISNISYGGLLVDYGSDVKEPSAYSEDPLEVEIEILGEKTTAFVNYVHTYQNESVLGYCFQHKNVETLVYLREILERFRIGASLRTPPTDMIKPMYRGTGWTCMRGEGPTDFTYRSKTASPSEFLLSFREGEYYNEVRLYQGKLSTATSTDIDGTSSQMNPSKNGLDENIAKKGVEILIGASNNLDKNENISAIIDMIAKHMRS